MKNLTFLIAFFCLSFSNISVAQTTVELTLQHKFEKSSFIAGQTYMNANNQAVLINQVQYYFSDLTFTHDGGLQYEFTNQHFLINGQQDVYNLGTVASSIGALERIDFNLGVDVTNNQLSPANFGSGHALATSDMYAVNQNSYIFLTIEGAIDTDNDNIPDMPFALKATNDALLRAVSLESKVNGNNGLLKINLTVNIAKWLEDINLETVGIQENDGLETETMMDNTMDNNVFTSTETTSIQTLVSPKNHIHVDSRLSFSPTIHYKFYTGEQLDMTITNVTGTYYIQRFGLNPEGDFFMNDDLASGIYIVVFTSPKGIRQSKRFVISR